MYLALKAVHILAVVAFLGNISLGLFWKRFADRTGDAAIMAHTMGGIIAADRLITVPSIIVIVAAGIGLATLAGIPVLGTGWLLWAIVLFVISGLAFIPVTRAQVALRQVAQTGMGSAEERARYARFSHAWARWGGIALTAPLIALALMVMKPTLPALH
jgi:uncharacterized membrane protein